MIQQVICAQEACTVFFDSVRERTSIRRQATGLATGGKKKFSAEESTGQVVVLMLQLEQRLGLFLAITHALSSMAAFLVQMSPKSALKCQELRRR